MSWLLETITNPFVVVLCLLAAAWLAVFWLTLWSLERGSRTS